MKLQELNARGQSSVSTVSSTRLIRARSKSINFVSTKYESLDYDICENMLVVDEERSKGYNYIMQINIIRYILFLVIGLLVGLITLFIDFSIQFLTQPKYRILRVLTDECHKHCYIYLYVVWCLLVMVPTAIGSFLAIYVESESSGSGVPAVLCYLNGVSMPRMMTLKTLVCKVAGVICAVVAGLGAGKEGPLIHIGTIIGGLIPSMNIPNRKISSYMNYFQNDKERRDFSAGGAAAGVAAAFGAPIGGVLMSLEEGTSFWSVLLMWRIFICGIISSFFFNFFLSWHHGHSGKMAYDELFFFGKFSDAELRYEVFELPLFILMGAIGGLIGALCVELNMWLTVFRSRFIKKKWQKFLEAMMVAFITVNFGVFSIYAMSNVCLPVNYRPDNAVQVNCKENEVNIQSYFWFQIQENMLKHLLHSPIAVFQAVPLLVHLLLYSIMILLTTGLSISAGLFIPNLIVGALWGRLFCIGLKYLFPHADWIIPGKYALVGAAVQLAGMVRCTISLSVVVIEATGNITFALPVMFALATTKWIGDFISEGVYEMQINLRGLPILPTDPPPLTSNITAEEIMSTSVVTIPTCVVVAEVLAKLKNTNFHCFPVVGQSTLVNTQDPDFLIPYGQLEGLILRSQLIVLLMNKAFEESHPADFETRLNMFRKAYACQQVDVESLELTTAEKEMVLDLRAYMNPSPYSVRAVTSLPRIFRLFRSLGLRHIIVVNNVNQVVGIVTRKDLARFRLWVHRGNMRLKELRVHS
ncbi:unnamed protein product [Bemisia tabaci]|uniref:Chloride channel protein n=2 Tax=Bemisia tabaci TaxID=7038 RepID=A0A9P0A6D2_BEMTA|nr:unnamed protein product [Bemisia tabaci]